MRRPLFTLLSLLAVTGSAQALTSTLSFDQATACLPGGCANGSHIDQTYGDVAGVVDVTYTDLVPNSTNTSLKWWDTAYNDLRGVLWSGSSDANGSSYARIEIKSLNGGLVTLNSMDFGSYPQTSRATNIVVSNRNGATLFSYNGFIGNGANSHNTFMPNVSAMGSLRIDWYDSAYNTGIDNVSFSVTSVPEPETYAMLLAGLGIIGGIAKRRAAKAK